MPKQPTVPGLPPLPTWTSATSVSAFLAVLVGYVVSFLVALHPGWTEPSSVTTLIPIAGQLVAAGFVIALVIIKRRAVAVGGGTLPLPSLGDAASVLTYLTTILSTVFALITALHPGFVEPAVVNAILPSVAALVAAVAQIVNVATHHAAVVSIHRLAALTK